MKKTLDFKNGEILINTDKDNIVRKNFSLKQETIEQIKDIADMLNCTESKAVEQSLKVVTKLIAEKDKVEKKVKKDLLSEQNLRQMQKYYRELGMKFDKEEVKQSIKEMLEQYSVVDLIRNNYIS